MIITKLKFLLSHRGSYGTDKICRVWANSLTIADATFFV